MKLKHFISICILMSLSLNVDASEHSHTGFYYPLKRDSFRTETGFWLNPASGQVRPDINGTYVLPGVFHAAIDMMANNSHDSVFAIADGEIHSISSNGWGADNIAIVVRHKLARSSYFHDNEYFYALYGHVRSSDAIKSGTVRAGQRIGYLGDYSGGNHLHFAIRNEDSTFDKFGTVSMSDWPTDKRAWELSDNNRHHLVDPVWFISHNIPDNYESRKHTSPSIPIGVLDPWFAESCVMGNRWTNPDQNCDMGQWDSATEAYLEPDSDLFIPTDGLPFWHPGSPNHVGSGGGGDINSIGPNPLFGPRSDTRPDFDIFNTSNVEISANSNTYTPKTVTTGQNVQMVLTTQVANADVKYSLRDSDSNSIEGPIWWKIETNAGSAVTGWNLLISEEFDVSDLDKNDEPDEKEWFNIPNYPGKTIVFAACTDGDDEVLEENESTTRKKATSPSNCGTNNRSRDENLRIAWPRPEVSTLSALNITQTSATLRGSIDAQGTATYSYFDYGTNTNFGKTVSLGNIGAGNNPITKSANIAGLSCGTTFYYRVRAWNTSGTSYGSTQSFRTQNCPGVTNDIKPVYGFWSSSVTGHHMTISESGKNNLINHPTWDWQFEGVYFHALTKQINNSVPVYQLWKSGYSHHYTSSLTERNRLLNSGDGWTEGTVAFYAYPSQRPGTVPIYRYYNGPITDHFFTKTAPSHYVSSCNRSLNGKTSLSSTNYNHCYEGIAWYAYPSMPARPWVLTGGATNITRTTATLQGRINTYGTEGYAYFDYGEDAAYGQTINLGHIGHSNSAILFTRSIGGLKCGTTYHYRIHANNDGGVSYGQDVIFKTSECPPPDTDGDGVLDNSDNCPLKPNANQQDFDGDGDGNACDPDDDNDGLSDKDELNVFRTNPLKVDTDGDGLSDYEEVTFYGINPLKTDTDGDGYSDGYEVKAGFDPTDPNDYPSNHGSMQVIIQYLLNNKN